jgi:hypothetical protein
MRLFVLTVVTVVGCTKEMTNAVTATATPSAAPSAAASASAAASTPPPTTVAGSVLTYGPPRPKGDGTCIADGMAGCTSPPCTRVVSAVPCPVIPTTKSSDEELGAAACGWAAACERMGDEGCCVGCGNPFRVKLSRTCALQIVSKMDCKSVQATWDACAGR